MLSTTRTNLGTYIIRPDNVVNPGSPTVNRAAHALARVLGKRVPVNVTNDFGVISIHSLTTNAVTTTSGNHGNRYCVLDGSRIALGRVYQVLGRSANYGNYGFCLPLSFTRLTTGRVRGSTTGGNAGPILARFTICGLRQGGHFSYSGTGGRLNFTPHPCTRALRSATT